jgi:hypothetical protein
LGVNRRLGKIQNDRGLLNLRRLRGRLNPHNPLQGIVYGAILRLALEVCILRGLVKDRQDSFDLELGIAAVEFFDGLTECSGVAHG